MVSVIVPVYNGEKTIERCLNSIINQTLQDLEIIVVNDGSTDNTLQIINSFKSDKIKIINQSTCGQGIARNNGIKLAKGDYIGFVDADDVINENMYKTMYAAGVKYDADLVQCGIMDIKNNVSHARATEISGPVKINNREEYAVDYFRGLKHTNEVCNKLIKKSFLLDNALSFDDTKTVFSEDLLLNINMLSYLNTVYYISEPFYRYNISENGHCLKGRGERLEKICTLFKKGVSNSADELKSAIRCFACNVILEYCVAEDKDISIKILEDEFVRECIDTSMRYRSTLKHSIIMYIIKALPAKKALKIVEYIIARRRKAIS